MGNGRTIQSFCTTTTSPNGYACELTASTWTEPWSPTQSTIAPWPQARVIFAEDDGNEGQRQKCHGIAPPAELERDMSRAIRAIQDGSSDQRSVLKIIPGTDSYQ